MSILKELGIDPQDFAWQDLSLCQNMNLIDPTTDREIEDPFYEGYEHDEYVAKAIDQMCSRCPVRTQCRTNAVINKEHGCWGGVYWDGQGRIDESRNSHKTPEELEEIKEWLSCIREQ